MPLCALLAGHRGMAMSGEQLLVERWALKRRRLAHAMFKSIPYEHRLGVTPYGGCTWGGRERDRDRKPSTDDLGKERDDDS